MNTTLYTVIEQLLYDMACGLHSERYVVKVLQGLGFTADLRGDSHIIAVCCVANGQLTRVTI